MEGHLRVRDLRVGLRKNESIVEIVSGVSFELEPGKSLGVVGESGCGKTTMALSLMRLIPDWRGKVLGGQVLWNNQNLLTLEDSRLRQFRWREIAMVFQDARTSLNHVFTVGSQLAEVFQVHFLLPHREAYEKTIELLRWVRISDPERVARSYPHELSGGMLQRVLLAMALSCHPKLLIADELTTALDATIQKQILDLLITLKRATGLSLIYISHDIRLLASLVDRIAVMYAGRIVEIALKEEIFRSPLHPYTKALLQVLLGPGKRKEHYLNPIPGRPPIPGCFPGGCKFAPRCPAIFDPCEGKEPPLIQVTPEHWVRCFLNTQ